MLGIVFSTITFIEILGIFEQNLKLISRIISARFFFFMWGLAKWIQIKYLCCYVENVTRYKLHSMLDHWDHFTGQILAITLIDKITLPYSSGLSGMYIPSYIFECLDFSWLWIRLIFWIQFIQTFARINKYLTLVINCVAELILLY